MKISVCRVYKTIMSICNLILACCAYVCSKLCKNVKYNIDLEANLKYQTEWRCFNNIKFDSNISIQMSNERNA